MKNVRVFLSAGLVVGLLFALQAHASAITFSWSGAPIVGEDPTFLPSGSAEFEISGSQLLITLTNDSGQTMRENWQTLTGLTWDIESGATLSPVSAVVPSGSQVYDLVGHPPVLVILPGINDISGEWAYRNGLSLGPYGISAVGSLLEVGVFGPDDLFDQDGNLWGPAGLNGVQGGIVGTDFSPNNGFVTPVVQNQVVFTFNFNGNLSESDFTDVNPIFGSKGMPTSVPPVPEPATLSLLGLGLVGLPFFRKRSK